MRIAAQSPCPAWASGIGPERLHSFKKRRAHCIRRPRASLDDENASSPTSPPVQSESTSSTSSPSATGPSRPLSPTINVPPLRVRRVTGLMTDSVLETKWRAQREQEREIRAKAERARPPETCPVLPRNLELRDHSQSDPYAAFSAFTRIAAPTAALGTEEDEVAARIRGLSKPGQHLGATLPANIPYSTGHLARRMMRYFLAKQNLDEFLSFFTGEFDNYEQVAEERVGGALPGEGGGHEHIHCSIVRPAENWLFARYYFNGNPNIVFRSRLYRVDVSDKSDRGIIVMRIFRFYEEVQQMLKANDYDLDKLQWSDDNMYNWLEGCEVYWERYQPDSEESDTASRALGIESGTRFVGYMEGGGCELFSNEINERIRVMDDLLLTSQQLWVADRAFDMAGNFVYGNRRGIPYKMKRVDPKGPLAWTLSPSTPPPEGYVP